MKRVILFALILFMLTSCVTNRSKTIELVGKDFQFFPDVIEAELGEKIIINFTNPDKVPHLIYLPEFNVHIGLAPGGNAPLEFIASKLGTFDYVCSVAGHQEAGMVGRLVISPIIE